ncbi:YodL-like [Sarcina sp. DSM 11001]|uniref:YodL domain-containing protein n=1 Tax=Sarcina sp. DSM 11001 TaxID=1798184 RepID=UPI000883CE5A|nr:YodL domain-containing protein [Sarcina sp. DSM 11001]SDM03427.1 YodL-like [Sarcina sp. DSM 11001]
MSEGLNQYVVYRLKRALRETRTRRHQSYQYLQKYQMEVISDLYDQIYLSEFDPSLSPLQLRRQLEKELPADSAGETLEISDVLAITRYGITSAYYVDPDKLVSLTGFFHVPSSRELLTPETTDFQIEGRPGTWLVAEDIWIDGNHFFLMQNQYFGRKAACAVLDSRGHPAAEDTTNGFSDAVIKQIREYIHGQKSENMNAVPDEPPELEPIQVSDIDEMSEPPTASGNESARIGVVGSIVEQIDSKPKNAADKKLDANKTEFEKTDIASDKGKRKKKQRHGKIPLRYRSSVLERLRRYQTKLAEERRKKE